MEHEGAKLASEVKEKETQGEKVIKVKEPECAEFSSEVEENETPGDKGERGMAGVEALSA